MRQTSRKRLGGYFAPERFWGHLELFGETQEPITKLDNEGHAYIADTRGPIYLQLRCDCGHAWEMLKSDFPGRRAMQSCGRPECKYTKPPKGPRRMPEQKGMATTVYLSKDCIEWLIAQAKKHGNSYSKELDNLLHRAMADAIVKES